MGNELNGPAPKSDLDVYDIAIIGAGIVGASLAAALSKDSIFSHLKIAIVDGGPEPKAYSGIDFDPRVVALTHNSERFFRKLGLWDLISQRSCAYRRMVVWDGEGTAKIEFDSSEFPLDELRDRNLGHIVENSAVVIPLLADLNDSDIEIWRGERVESIQLPCTEPDLNGAEPGNTNLQFTSIELSNGQKFGARLVVAADGANSKVRQLLNMPTREWEYGHSAIVTTVRAKKSHQDTAWQRFMRTGPLAFLPLPEIDGKAGYCSIVWSVESDEALALMAMGDKDFSVALESAFESQLGSIESVAPRFSFPLRQRHAKNYVLSGVALLGDAAHTIHPLAGQGVNLGLLDVQAFVEELKRGQKRGLPVSEYSILQRYQRQRMGKNLAVMGLMEGFKRLFESQNPAVQVARNWGMDRLQKFPPLKNIIARKAMGFE